jgi:hypothetical protein
LSLISPLHVWSSILYPAMVTNKRISAISIYSFFRVKYPVDRTAHILPLLCRLKVLQSSIFWDIMPCSPLKVRRRFGGRYRLNIRDRQATHQCETGIEVLQVTTCSKLLHITIGKGLIPKIQGLM